MTYDPVIFCCCLGETLAKAAWALLLQVFEQGGWQLVLSGANGAAHRIYFGALPPRLVPIVDEADRVATAGPVGAAN